MDGGIGRLTTAARRARPPRPAATARGGLPRRVLNRMRYPDERCEWPAAVALVEHVATTWCSALAAPRFASASPLTAPFLGWAEHSVRAGLDVYPADAIQADTLTSDAVGSLRRTLDSVAASVARVPYGIEGGRPTRRRSTRSYDDTEPASMFALEEVRDPRRWRAFMSRHGGLSRLLADRCLAWRSRMVILIDAWIRDARPLTVACGGEPGALSRVRWRHLFHDDAVVQSSSNRMFLFGGDAPRLDPRVARLLCAVAKRLDCEPFPIAEPVGDGAWVVVPRPVHPASDGERAELSRRIGLLLAVLRVCGVRAVGSHALVVRQGAVTLLPFGWTIRNPSGDAPAPGLAAERLRESVLAVGLIGGDGRPDMLPSTEPLDDRDTSAPLDDDPEDAGAGWSALAAPDGELSAPTLLVDDTIAGFVDAYRALQGDSSLLEAWSDDSAPTATLHAVRRSSAYRDLLARATGANAFASAAQRLNVCRAALDDAPAVGRPTPAVIDAEARALAGGEIPSFVDAGRGDLILPDGSRVHAYFGTPISTAIRARAARLDDADLTAEVHLLDRMVRPSRPPGSPWAHEPASAAAAAPLSVGERQELRDGAIAAGEWLLKTAIRDGSRIDWIGVQPGEGGMRTIRPVGHDLYHGLAGIGLFLVRLGRATADDRFTSDGMAAIEGCRNRLATLSVRRGGGFTGALSMAFVLAHVAIARNDPAMCQEAAASIQSLALDPVAFVGDDVLAGRAGAIKVLLELGEASRCDALFGLAQRLGRGLVRDAVADTEGYWWPAAHVGEPLPGFAHGVVGIAWALAHVSARLPETRIARAVTRALAFAEALRRRDLVWTRAPSWCHGPSGIGLALATLPATHFSAAERTALVEIASALADHPGGGVTCLCHGEFGNLETLLLATARLDDARWAHIAQRRALALVRHGGDHWREASNAGPAAPGFMLGVAGLGYMMLRVGDPANVPSILSLAPPAAVP